ASTSHAFNISDEPTCDGDENASHHGLVRDHGRDAMNDPLLLQNDMVKRPRLHGATVLHCASSG
ncbi:MAG: hypothetical protein QM639_05155, partial [Rhodocyclaceae bacterium]